MKDTQLQVVFPVSGYSFGRNSQPWVQILVSDVQQEKKGVREINYILQVLENQREISQVKSPNGRRVYLSHLHEGAHDLELVPSTFSSDTLMMRCAVLT
eukprot:1678002-Rhodomonas_salina.3